jgi:hypothetical protein
MPAQETEVNRIAIGARASGAGRRIRSATIRLIVSIAAPAANGTIMVTGRVG